MLYVFGFVAVAVSLDSIVFGGWYTQTFSNAELSILKSVWGFLPNRLGNIRPAKLNKRRKVFVRRKRIGGHRVDVSKDILGVSYSMAVSSVNVPKSRVFRDRAEECRTMAALFHGEKTRALLLRVAADYDCMADRAAMFELQDADREARAIPLGALAQA